MLSNRMINTGICILATASLGLAQLKADGDASINPNFSSRNTSTAGLDGIAVKGESNPQPNWGIGVSGEGGYIGVLGNSTLPGAGTRYGGQFNAYNGAQANYGVYSFATGVNAFAGYFSGNVHISGVLTNTSDSRLKTNIQPLQANLQKLSSLRPSSYNFDASRTDIKGLPDRKQLGLLAEDVAAVLPELITEVPIFPDGAEGKNVLPGTAPTYKSVNYLGMIPVLVGAIKEQQAEIAALKDALAKLSK